MSTDERLLPIAEAIAEGRPVDWDAIPPDADPMLIRQLREIAGLAGRLEETSRHGPFAMDADSPGAAPGGPPGQPARFGHLRIDEVLGRGSNGTVYRAWDEVLARHVALKLCAPQAARKDQMLREARLIAQLDHPNVLKVHGAAEHDGLVGFWAELVDGEPMGRWSESHPRLSARELCAIAEDLAAALAAIHALDVVHGDLKPANVVRHRDGRWIVLDFGSSTPLSGRFESGTPAYAAPELLTGGPPARSTDLYSLAAVLFRLATGRLPVEAETFEELKQRSARGDRLHLLDLRPDLPPRFAAEIERALSPDPAARPASAGAFAQALAAALRPAEGERRSRWPLYGALGAALLGALALASLWRAPPPAPPAGASVAFEKSVPSGAMALRDGDRIAPGDALALTYRNTRPAYVYVLNEDDGGNVFKLFPLAGAELANPLPAGTALRLPGRVAGVDQDWRVTSRGGRERFFVVIADTAVPALEELQVAEAQGTLPSSGEELLARNDTVRGVGGLAARPQATALGGTRMGTWLEGLRSRIAGLEVQRLELVNP